MKAKKNKPKTLPQLGDYGYVLFEAPPNFFQSPKGFSIERIIVVATESKILTSSFPLSKSSIVDELTDGVVCKCVPIENPGPFAETDLIVVGSEDIFKTEEEIKEKINTAFENKVGEARRDLLAKLATRFAKGTE